MPTTATSQTTRLDQGQPSGWSMRALILVSAAVLLLAFGCASATPKIVINGNFEVGNLDGWLTTSGGSGRWLVYQDGSTPPDRTITDPNVPFQMPNPPEGKYAAVTDMNGPGTRILSQVLKLDRRYTLRCTIFYKNGAPVFANRDTFEVGSAENQQFRIDIMKPTARVSSLAEQDVLATIFRTSPGDPLSLEPKTISFDLSAWAGQTVRLRFAQADNLGPFRVGVDEVRLDRAR